MGMVKKVFNAVTTTNTIESGGGLSSLLVPRKMNALGSVLTLGGMAMFGTGKEVYKARNQMKTGTVKYLGGPARMTHSFTSGAVQSMNKVARGDYAAFSDMAEEAMTNTGVYGAIENYGVTPQFISAVYGMRR